ncbi:MAG: arsenic-transporting ATPase [Gemmatimonadetes bacterium]|nr:arsenic-transporting ATPase [Gemmatimonadota bacterium]
MPLEGHSILFVGGKGGVGKSTTAASLAVHLADSGEKILLVSTDPAHSLGDLFGTSVGDRKREIVPGLHALEIDPGQEVEKYLARVKSTMRHYVQPAMYSEIERQIELTRHSPGAEEAALMDQVTTLMQEVATSHDRIIFDTAPTGHTLRLLALPEIMAAWTTGLLKSRERSDSLGKAVDRLRGREQASGDELAWFDDVKEEVTDERTQKIQEVLLERQRRFSKARRLLLDPEITAFILVLIPEKLPILESEKTHAVLRQHKIPVAGLVVNRTLPNNQALGEFLESRRSQEAEYLGQIDRTFSKLPQVRIPLLSRDVQGIDALREIAQHLLIGK